ncbi:hypothetical protein HSX11_12130 [Oxalobacteraceae bacterium]|nr:hypothetical protein [Oxalobacteraceae bacterium]
MILEHPVPDDVDMPELHAELLPNIPARNQAAQSWQVSVVDAKFHWYDLITGFPDKPDMHNPVGRYIRRMQFDLEAATEKQMLYFVVQRPRMRFDPSRSVHWSFFGLKLSIPVLTGSEDHPVADILTIELKVPFSATLKKPSTVLDECFITLNWGGCIEALTVHDLLRTFDSELRLSTRVLRVGQTRDPAGLMAKGRLPAVQKLCQQFNDSYDTLLLIAQIHTDVTPPEADPGLMPDNQNRVAEDALSHERLDVIESALARYFEGSGERGRSSEEKQAHRERLRQIQADQHLQQFSIDLAFAEGGNYRFLGSEHVAKAERHLLDCQLVDGEVQVRRVPTTDKE